jgi:hypothetical protein
MIGSLIIMWQLSQSEKWWDAHWEFWEERSTHHCWGWEVRGSSRYDYSVAHKEPWSKNIIKLGRGQERSWILGTIFEPLNQSVSESNAASRHSVMWFNKFSWALLWLYFLFLAKQRAIFPKGKLRRGSKNKRGKAVPSSSVRKTTLTWGSLSLYVYRKRVEPAAF